MKTKRTPPRDRELATQAARIWRHREHEANGFWRCCVALACIVGVDSTSLSWAPNRNILHCFWCSKVKVSAVVYDP